ncbi:hypothetical protein L9F63_015160, partial [Diploptera punctata]
CIRESPKATSWETCRIICLYIRKKKNLSKGCNSLVVFDGNLSIVFLSLFPTDVRSRLKWFIFINVQRKWLQHSSQHKATMPGVLL